MKLKQWHKKTKCAHTERDVADVVASSRLGPRQLQRRLLVAEENLRRLLVAPPTLLEFLQSQIVLFHTAIVTALCFRLV